MMVGLRSKIANEIDEMEYLLRQPKMDGLEGNVVV
jgi:hypothetical protein